MLLVCSILFDSICARLPCYICKNRMKKITCLLYKIGKLKSRRIYWLTAQVLSLISTILQPGIMEVNMPVHSQFFLVAEVGERCINKAVILSAMKTKYSRKRVDIEQSVLSLND